MMTIADRFAELMISASDEKVLKQLIKAVSKKCSMPSFYLAKVAKAKGIETNDTLARWVLVNPANREVVAEGGNLAEVYPMDKVYEKLREFGMLDLIPEKYIGRMAEEVSFYYTIAKAHCKSKEILMYWRKSVREMANDLEANTHKFYNIANM